MLAIKTTSVEYDLTEEFERIESIREDYPDTAERLTDMLDEFIKNGWTKRLVDLYCALPYNRVLCYSEREMVGFWYDEMKPNGNEISYKIGIV